MGTAWSFQDFKALIDGGSGGQVSLLAACASWPAARVAPAAVPACKKRRLEIIYSPSGHCPDIIVSVLKGRMFSWNPASNAQAARVEHDNGGRLRRPHPVLCRRLPGLL